jgi:terminase small subunit / prophage DNA-packing protein
VGEAQGGQLVRVNRRQLADILGISLPTVTAWTNEGMPFTREGSKSAEWEFETRECIEWFGANKLKLRPRQPTRGKNPFDGDDSSPETIDEAERRKMIANADKAEVQVAKEAGILVPISEVASVVAEENARVRARLLTLPNELRPKVLTFLAEDRKAAEQLLADTESVVLEALSEIRSWAPAPADVEEPPEEAPDDSDTDS